ncbi:MAG: dinitrogenase iron-molybdenum cofactor biosynthesis protein [Elusimicrobia bacterium]|jgi:predicted Fe-Mo cluster-binding NifX family protein|nr:dinitrogenase iron-molybdenum cofactor biosynthesis protein [Elusimicrobiota bacterium]
MNIASTSTGGSMSAQVAQSFGRCAYFIIADTDNIKDFEPIQNSAASAAGGAGPQAAKIINEKGAKILLTSKVGPNAEGALKEYGIKAVEGISGKVKDAIEEYVNK